MTAYRSVRTFFALVLYVLAVLYVSPYVVDFDKPFMQGSLSAWVAHMSEQAAIIQEFGLTDREDEFCGVSWMKVERSFSWPTLTDEDFNSHVQRQMLIALFSFVLESALFLWKKVCYTHVERCNSAVPAAFNLRLQRSMQQPLTFEFEPSAGTSADEEAGDAGGISGSGSGSGSGRGRVAGRTAQSKAMV